MKYKICASLKQDMDEGWVWLNNPVVYGRPVVKIKCKNKTIFCEARRIDDNYVRDYKAKERTIPLDMSKNVLTINEWYRGKLRIEKNKCYDLLIMVENHYCGRLRANLDHPQNVIRLATQLGLVSIFLGFVGIGISLYG